MRRTRLPFVAGQPRRSHNTINNRPVFNGTRSQPICAGRVLRSLLLATVMFGAGWFFAHVDLGAETPATATTTTLRAAAITRTADTSQTNPMLRLYPPPAECQTTNEGSIVTYDDGAVLIVDTGCVLDAEDHTWRTIYDNGS